MFECEVCACSKIVSIKVEVEVKVEVVSYTVKVEVVSDQSSEREKASISCTYPGLSKWVRILSEQSSERTE